MKKTCNLQAHHEPWYEQNLISVREKRCICLAIVRHEGFHESIWLAAVFSHGKEPVFFFQPPEASSAPGSIEYSQAIKFSGRLITTLWETKATITISKAFQLLEKHLLQLQLITCDS